MPEILLGANDSGLISENILRKHVLNFYAIANETTPNGLSWVSRPTLGEYATVGLGPISGIWRQDATFDGDILVISGEELYRIDSSGTPTLVGEIPGSGNPQFAGTSNRVIIVRDGVAYSTDGTVITQVVMPDDVLVGSVATINGYFILSVLNDQIYYWIAPGETDPDGLSFSSAERIPDFIVSVQILQDEVWFLGTAGPEVCQTTDDPDAPFIRITGRVYNEGCRNKDTVCPASFNNLPCLIWVTPTGSIVMAQGSVAKISRETEEELVRNSTNLRAWTFRHNKHDFYILSDPSFTLVYDLQTQRWFRWESYMQDYWFATIGTQNQSLAYCTGPEDNKIYILENGYSDVGVQVERRIAGIIQNPSKPYLCYNILVKANVGWSPEYDIEPTLELRWSDDGGTTWTNWVQKSLGNRGEYTTTTVFRSLGLIRESGRVIEYRFTDFARFRLDYSLINEM